MRGTQSDPPVINLRHPEWRDNSTDAASMLDSPLKEASTHRHAVLRVTTTAVCRSRDRSRHKREYPDPREQIRRTFWRSRRSADLGHDPGGVGVG